ncbi:MAG: hypothetical protein WEB03_06660 [Nitriliruptor sp.]|uniref:hypothetical protein n=1 Tax=Nitriliruptor sp. TaxID=2448056 RepID=UPI0034A04B6A
MTDEPTAAPDAPVDPLDPLRTELEGPVDRLPVVERLARFEHANEVLARELAVLDEV